MSELDVSPETLIDFVASVLAGHGVPDDASRVCAQRMVDSDLRGRHAHGVFRLPAYCERIRAGGLNASAAIRLERETSASALVDGDNGLGPVVATFAVETVVRKATASGIAWVGVRGANHAGAAGVYAAMMADAGLVGIVMAVANTNQMAPWGGTESLLGTNPIAIGIPTGGTPVVVDIATTVTSFGEVKRAAAEGRELPEGWMVDRAGAPLRDSSRFADGILCPIAGYKGFGLSLAIGLVAGVLNGAYFGREVVDQYADLVSPTNTGFAFVGARIDLFREGAEVTHEIDRHLATIRDSHPMNANQAIQIPGDAAARRRAEQLQSGISVDAKLKAQLDELAAVAGVPALGAELSDDAPPGGRHPR
jgi:LDH2 family malate/lactate/ureidoglycolate dehydrogenase